MAETSLGINSPPQWIGLHLGGRKGSYRVSPTNILLLISLDSSDGTLVFRCQWHSLSPAFLLSGRSLRDFSSYKLHVLTHWLNKCQAFVLRRKWIWTNKLGHSLQPVTHLNTIWTQLVKVLPLMAFVIYKIKTKPEIKEFQLEAISCLQSPILV